MPVIKDVTVSEMCVEDLGGDTCLTAVVDVTEDGLPSRYYATIAEDYNNFLCVKRIPFGALFCRNYDFAPWDIVPDSVVEAIRNAGIEKKLLKICQEGYCAKGDKSCADEDEYPNKFPWAGDDFFWRSLPESGNFIHPAKKRVNNIYRRVGTRLCGREPTA